MRTGGIRGNEQLTVIAAALLVAGLAVEGATLLDLRSFLTVHAFVGMLLIPIVALKLASVGWRMIRYYRGGAEYVTAGPPHVLLRSLVAPVIVVATVALFGTGVALLALGRTDGTLVGLHKAAFIVWLGAAAIHVLAHLAQLRRSFVRGIPGAALRLAAVGAALAAGSAVAVGTLPGADHLQDRVTAHIGVDAH